VQAGAQPEGPAQVAGPSQRPGAAGEALERLGTAQQDRARRAPCRLGHDVHAVMDPVAHVDVGVARPPEHGRGPKGPAAVGVRSRVVRPEIRLDLDDAGDLGGSVALEDQKLAEEIARDP